MSKYTDVLTAEELIRFIATDYVELSHDKVVALYHEHMKICRDWIAVNQPTFHAGGLEGLPRPLKDDF
jgi:hypothetical protein